MSVSQVLSMQIGKSLNGESYLGLGTVSLSFGSCMKSWKTSKTILNAECVGKPIRFLVVECLESAIGAGGK